MPLHRPPINSEQIKELANLLKACNPELLETQPLNVQKDRYQNDPKLRPFPNHPNFSYRPPSPPAISSPEPTHGVLKKKLKPVPPVPEEAPSHDNDPPEPVIRHLILLLRYQDKVRELLSKIEQQKQEVDRLLHPSHSLNPAIQELLCLSHLPLHHQ